MPEVLVHCAEAAGWEKPGNVWMRPAKGAIWPSMPPSEEVHLKRGVGFAVGIKNIGFSFGFPEQCWATVELHGEREIQRAVVRHAGADVGQGAHTVFSQMAAEALDISVDQVEMIPSDTATTGNSGSVSASRMTFMAGNSIRGAVELALARWQDEDRPAIGTFK